MDEPVTSRSASSPGAAEKVVAGLLARLFSGDLLPGNPLREVALAEEFGVSRNTVRDALRRLIAANLAEAHRHRGVAVKAMEPEDVRDIFLVRRTIELRAVEESGTATQEACDNLRRQLELANQLDADADWATLTMSGLRVHQAIVSLLGSPRLDDVFEALVAQIRLAFAVISDQANFQTSYGTRLSEICDLLSAGSRASAGALLRAYLDDSERELLEAISVSRSSTPAQP
jgi:DNA-binding GntR family transcriptional regulator